jgi:plastocyanin
VAIVMAAPLDLGSVNSAQGAGASLGTFRHRRWIVRTRKRYLLLAGVLGAAIAVVPAIAESSPTVSGTESLMWVPPEVTVAPGGTVTFQDTSTVVPHGIVWEAGNPSTPVCTGVPINKGETHWKGSCTFTNVGTYRYFCFVHGMAMSGRVIVSSTPPPTVTKLSPNNGPVAGGSSVTITGTNFTGATAVKFGSASATSFKVNSATSITAVSPAESAGTVNVTVATPTGTSAISSADHFKFAPTVTNLSPNSGSHAGGTSVMVTGTGFGLGTTATRFKFGSTAATAVNCTSITTCTVVAPAHLVGKVDVKATVNKVASATNRPGDQFTYN